MNPQMDADVYSRNDRTMPRVNHLMTIVQRPAAQKSIPTESRFYHLPLRGFVVVDLKKGDFKPEYAGKMNFYCSVVDDKLRHLSDVPTLGLILCQTKDRVLAEYALRDIYKPVGVADYEVNHTSPRELASSLPSIESLEQELSQGYSEEDADKGRDAL